MMRRTTLALLLWFLLLHAVFIYVYLKGFLLTRIELADVSPLRVTVESTQQGSGTAATTTTTCTWATDELQSVSRVLIFLVDALRLDFLTPVVDDSFDAADSDGTGSSGAPPGSSSAASPPAFYRNQFSLPLSNSTLLYEFVADPPTTTMQRLKALTTGSLPTFIDAGSNFASTRITADNLLLQLNRTGRSAVFAGDDTWLSLFPESFVRTYPWSSFDVRDLHSVDRTVRDALPRELNASNQDWSLFVGHFLGVDHVGHRFGPAHAAMRDKLRELSGIVREALQAVEGTDTLVLVMGDHGMTATGDHGGARPSECAAGLYVRGARPLPLVRADTAAAAATGDPDEARALAAARPPPRYLLQQADDVPPWRWPATLPAPVLAAPQVDLVPTLALLLGLPVPFGSLGKPMLPLLLQHDRPGVAGALPESVLSAAERARVWQRAAMGYRLTALQVTRYLRAYAGVSSGFAAEPRLHALLAQMAAAERAADEAGCGCEPAPALPLTEALVQRRRAVVGRYIAVLDEALALCRHAWTAFDERRMVLGALGLALTAVAAVLAAALVRWTAVPAAAAAGTASRPAEPAGDASVQVDVLMPGRWALVAAALAGVTLAVTGRLLQWSRHDAVDASLGAAALVSVVLFLVQAAAEVGRRRAIWPSWPGRLRLDDGAAAAALCLYAASMTSNSFLDAEPRIVFVLLITLTLLSAGRAVALQQPVAAAYLLVGAVSARVLSGLGGSVPRMDQPPPVWVWATALFLLGYMLRVALWQRGAVHGIGRLMRSWLPAGCALVGVYWYGMTASAEVPWVWRVAVPRTVLALSGGSLLLCVLAPLGVRIEQAGDTQQVTVKGLHLALESAALCVLCAVAPAVLLVSGPSAAAAWVLALMASLGLLTGLQRTGPTPTFGTASMWMLLASGVFFATGHRAAFNALQFDAAFVGFDAFFMPVSGPMVALNTLAPALLFGFLTGTAAMWGGHKEPGSTHRVYLLDFNSPALWWRASRPLLAALVWLSVPLAVSALFTLVQRRHLMVWAIFAPKLLFSVAWSGSALVALLLGHVFMTRAARALNGLQARVVRMRLQMAQRSRTATGAGAGAGASPVAGSTPPPADPGAAAKGRTTPAAAPGASVVPAGADAGGGVGAGATATGTERTAWR